ncbi:MAG: GGDEF domain-containing protein [Spirochaetales bacterium]|nr:GGDEF domain-containing protein [Spirochaetales bacterium]
MGIPLIHYGDVIGIMALDSLKPGAYRQYHIELAQVIAVHVVIALENARLHEKAYKMAMEDALTKIGSRYRFQMEGRIMFETARRAKSSISFIIFDIDHFKKVNDNYGHLSGDSVLQMMAKAVSEEVRIIDLFARYGGEEFVVILPETEDSAALTVFKRINNKLAGINYPRIKERVTVSAGVFSGIPEKDDSMETFVSRADEALYFSKNNGRNRITLYSSQQS